MDKHLETIIESKVPYGTRIYMNFFLNTFKSIKAPTHPNAHAFPTEEQQVIQDSKDLCQAACCNHSASSNKQQKYQVIFLPVNELPNKTEL